MVPLQAPPYRGTSLETGVRFPCSGRQHSDRPMTYGLISKCLFCLSSEGAIYVFPAYRC